MELPLPVKDWHKYLLPSIVIYVGGLSILLIASAVHSLLKAARQQRDEQSSNANARTTVTLIKQRITEFANGRTLAGRIQLVLIFCLSLASYSLYLIDASRTAVGVPIRYSINWNESTLLQIDFAFNLIFLMHFILRFFTATNKLNFWLSWQSMVDIATIPTSFTYITEGEYWCALRFSRATYIIMLPELMETVGLLKDTGKIRLIQFSVRFFVLCFVSAGVVHLLENSGDPWMNEFNGQKLAYWQCIYYLIVTSSTVGYGDITCKTVLGQAFACAYIFVGLAMFANALPQVLNILQITSQYKGRLILPEGKRHVLVCGCFTAESAIKFSDIFLHPDWGLENVILVFISPEMPSIEFQALLNRQKNIAYICGNDMEAHDLERAAINCAEACIILANQAAEDHDNEDTANIMRAIAIKNVNGTTRILVQLLLQHNKQHISTIPNWNSRDVALSFDELKMGILATNCLAPGFCTFMSLVIRQYGRADIQSNEGNDTPSVYVRGSGMEIYEGDLSPDFIGMQFGNVSTLCYVRINLLLFGITSNGTIRLNPGKQYVIKPGDRGFFIAENVKDVDRAFRFCRKCHCELQEVAKMAACRCKLYKAQQNYHDRMKINTIEHVDEEIIVNERVQSLLDHEKRKRSVFDIHQDCPLACETEALLMGMATQHEQVLLEPVVVEDDVTDVNNLPRIVKERFDYTGTFYWCEPRCIDEACLTIDDARTMNFKKHVVLCVFGTPLSARLGLRNFVMPLRASNRTPEELMPIVIIGDRQYIAKEWPEVNAFPSIYIVSASPMKRNVLRAVNLEKCKMCVIVTARSGSENRMLMDKHAILCYLNIKSMKFGAECCRNLNENLDRAKGSVRITVSASSGARSKAFWAPTAKRALSAAPRIVNNIPVLADVALPENILILDDDVTHTTDTPLILMNPFACGNICAGDLLDSFTCTAYFNPSSVKLIRQLITGGNTSEIDNIFEEGLDLCEGKTSEVINAKRMRCRVSEISLNDPQYALYGEQSCTFAELFTGMLHKNGCICLAVCRLREQPHEDTKSVSKSQRFVLVNPPDTFKLLPTDNLICLQPFTVSNQSF